jgi:hypothetical protein
VYRIDELIDVNFFRWLLQAWVIWKENSCALIYLATNPFPCSFLMNKFGDLQAERFNVA